MENQNDIIPDHQAVEAYKATAKRCRVIASRSQKYINQHLPAAKKRGRGRQVNLLRKHERIAALSEMWAIFNEIFISAREDGEQETSLLMQEHFERFQNEIEELEYEMGEK